MTKLKQRLYRGGVVVAALAVAAVPLSAGAATSNTTISAIVGSTISISSGPTVSINLAPGGSAVVSSAADTVTVNTNNTSGYTLTLANADTDTDLESGASSIPAHAGTPAAPTVLADNTWGFAIAGAPFSGSYTAEDNETGSTTLWAGVPASNGTAATLKTTGTTAVNDTTTVWYGVRVNSAQANGTYSDIVTYSATTN